MFKTRNAPVPYVDFTSPAAKHAWPTNAACWSPAIPHTAARWPNALTSPKSPAESLTSGSIDTGTGNITATATDVDLRSSGVELYSSIYDNVTIDASGAATINFAMHDPEFRDNPPAPDTGTPRTRPFDFQQHLYNQSHPDIVRFLERHRELTDSYGGRFTVAEVGGPTPEAEMHAFTRGSSSLNGAYGFDFLYAAQLTPALRPAAIRSKWAGLRTFASDECIVVGEDPQLRGFFWLAGQGGVGIETSPAVGAITNAGPAPGWKR